MATVTTEPVRLPPGPRTPKVFQGLAFMKANHDMFAALGRRFGGAITVNLPVPGRAVVISDPVLVKDVFSTSPDLVQRPTYGVPPSLGVGLGPGSTFSLAGDELLERRKIVFPPFHGKRVKSYEQIVEDEVMREIATWPEGREFKMLPPMIRVTLNVVLNAVFRAEGHALDELRRLVPPMVTLLGPYILLPADVAA